MSPNLWKIWLLLDPRRTLVALFSFLTVLGLLIHMIVLSTDLNWLDDGIPVSYQKVGAQINAKKFGQ
ncbi:light-harvesting antenna LH1, alpha subunit [Caldichromatium japonicum]|uniref:light-harvesting antenna LH1, alpha subunit n=1 Tax=Caldichromatium japonicum TaxID=2699430 RepID=UPI001B357FF2|nr:light-harvesting antenna LH1, alpha subunit [Caldichromatium japonicum]